MWARVASSLTEMRPSSARSRSKRRSTSSSALRADDRPAMVVYLPAGDATSRNRPNSGRTSRSPPRACTYCRLGGNGRWMDRSSVRASATRAESQPERLDLPLDHPGRSDEEYLARRAAIAAVGVGLRARPADPDRGVHAGRARVVGARRARAARQAREVRLRRVPRRDRPPRAADRSRPAARAGHRPAASG